MIIPAENKAALTEAMVELASTLQPIGAAHARVMTELAKASREAFVRGHGDNFANAVTPGRINQLIRSAMIANGLSPIFERTAMSGADHRDVVDDLSYSFEQMIRGL